MGDTSVTAHDLAFSDPKHVAPPPPGSIGFPSHDNTFDFAAGFRSPPKGYGEVAFFWWLGAPLTKDRLAWQLDQLQGMSITGLQINYAHTDKGGLSYGLTIPSDPQLFSQAWWQLVEWFVVEANARGMTVSLSDYTLGPGQGWVIDQMIEADPSLNGFELKHIVHDVTPSQQLELEVSPDLISAVAYPAGRAPGVDLRSCVRNGRLRWTAPSEPCVVVLVMQSRVVPSLDPMRPGVGERYAEAFFGQFDRRFPGLSGHGLNFFFSDELEFRLRGRLWNERFAEEFLRRKSYDVIPELPLLWLDLGDRAAKVRMDYNDVQVAMSEECFFKPVFEWHQRRGMTLGCDHWGRGTDVTAFGDYFRTQRWNQGPGCDQPRLERDLIRNKVAASIAHLYERPRVWLEGFHSSGWGTSTAEVADATFANFGHGQNLLTLHGLYYATQGGWWEWAPPDNHWRMPYWRHMGPFMRCVERLSYLLSQGRHVCDVAVLYPVAAVEARLEGETAVKTAFMAAERLYARQIDFDFIDFQSVDRATVVDKRLTVAGEAYRVLVFPAMPAIRHSTLEAALNFHRAGGLVLAVGTLPTASDRNGNNDPLVAAMVSEIFADASNVLNSPEELAARVAGAFTADIACDVGNRSIQMLHRRIGPRHVYYFYGVPLGTRCMVRTGGRAEVLDPWTGLETPLDTVQRVDVRGEYVSEFSSPLTEFDPLIVVFSLGSPPAKAVSPRPVLNVEHRPLEGNWRVNYVPTLDNRWGDFQVPAAKQFIGPQTTVFRYASEDDSAAGWEQPDLDDRTWETVRSEFGPVFLHGGPFPAHTENLARMETVVSSSVHPGDVRRTGSDILGGWREEYISWRWGVFGDPGHQGYHGLKSVVPDEFIRLGKLVAEQTEHRRVPFTKETAFHYLWTTVYAHQSTTARALAGGMLPEAVWLNGNPLDLDQGAFPLHAGANALLLKYGPAGTGYFLLVDSSFVLPDAKPELLAMRWDGVPGIFPYDVRPGSTLKAGWFRFTSPPGATAVLVPTRLPPACWVDGRPCPGEESESGVWRFTFSSPHSRGHQVVAVRIEQTRGLYAGAVITGPVRYEFDDHGEMSAGDWSKICGLETYSGGVRYARTVTLTDQDLNGSITVDLGKVAGSAQLVVNGTSLTPRITPPWRWSVDALLRHGANQIEIVVFSTLANYFKTVPTRYAAPSAAGLIGPVFLELSSRKEP